MPIAVRTRHVRAAAVAGTSFGLGLVGHLAGGGHTGSTGSLLFGAAFCALSGWSCSWRRLPAVAVAGVLLANQTVMHVAMFLGTSSAGQAMGPDCAMADGSDTMTIIPSGWMLAAHLVASVLAAALIVTTEAVWLGLSALARWIARVVRTVLLALPTPSRRSGTVRAAVPHWTTRAVGARPGRGPPLLSASW
jgi:hypothetical protein